LAAAIRQGHRVPQLDPVPDLDQAYAIHAALPAATGRPVIGWKAGATAEAPQQAFGLSEPFYAPLLDGYLYQDRASLPVATFQKRAVEVEVAVRLAKDMDTVPGDPAIAGDYIDDLMPAIEVLDHRFADWDGLAATSMIADLGGNAALVLGAPVAGWRDVDLAAETTQLLVDGEPVAEGQGAAVMGHPFNSLIWLAGKRLAAGAPLRAGEIVTTGTWLGNKVVPAGKDIAARFERLGEVHLRFE
jgi:2-keto-4-pentenoate hydratase